MALELTFLISGLLLVLLIFEKARVLRKGRNSFVLRLISKGDESLSEIAHRGAHLYADSKERAQFLVRKQLPLHSRNLYNKSKVVLKEKADLLIGDIRGVKFLKRNEGISEFFKALSEKENETLEKEASEHADSQNGENKVE